jgi:uncharacterized protein YdaU (DUF1376 family)
MQYYQFHLGDYISHTAHLEPLEDLAYRRLLDLYYSTEKPIPNDIPWVSRRLRLGSDVIEIVLNEFFELSGDVWQNHRCNVEIDKFNEWISKQRSNGKKGGRPRKQPQSKPKITHGKPIANPSKSDGKPIVKPPTTHNPLPITQEPTEREDTHERMPGVFIEFLKAKQHIVRNDLNQWRAAWGTIAANSDNPTEVFEWAKDNYRASVSQARYFVKDSWPKISTAFQNRNNIKTYGKPTQVLTTMPTDEQYAASENVERDENGIPIF